MAGKLLIHFDNYNNYTDPVLIVQDKRAKTKQFSPTKSDDFGVIFTLSIRKQTTLMFRFGDRDQSIVEDDTLIRKFNVADITNQQNEIWCRGWNAFVYTQEPQIPSHTSLQDIVRDYQIDDSFFIDNTGGAYALGCTKTASGYLFSIFHPHAANIYLTGDFNNWQHPGLKKPKEDQFLRMNLHRGYFDVPNLWYIHIDEAQAGQEYKFYIDYGSFGGEHIISSRLMPDPYSRFLGTSYEDNNSLIVEPSTFDWHDQDYRTPSVHELIIYELHVHGLTHDNPHIEENNRSKYQGIINLLNDGYFDNLGITCLYLMPISEVPTPQGETALGYNTSLFMAIERDFGTPDELRQLVDTAHQHNIAVIIDQVFNHSANSWNPLWQFILDHPSEASTGGEGGIYFSGESPWGNRIATERAETQFMLIDACKMMIEEYHIDGFRFDATNSMYMDHGFLHYLADELQAFKPDVILIAENLPNEADLNRDGYNGYGQWCDFFHDTMKAFLREGQFEGTDDHPERLGDVFYFSKGNFASHTNNVINYCESHDEHSVSYEVGFSDNLNTPQAKMRKARLGLFATMVALGQPMLYMGQEFGTERERNIVYFDFPEDINHHGFYQWASRLINLRKRYPALKLHGFNPIEDSHFSWLIGPWLGQEHGGGKRVLGWRSTPTFDYHDFMVVLLNFENHAVEVDIPFNFPGKWVQLASIDHVNDIEPVGSNSADDERSLIVEGTFHNFVLPDSSGFIYKWEAPL